MPIGELRLVNFSRTEDGGCVSPEDSLRLAKHLNGRIICKAIYNDNCKYCTASSISAGLHKKATPTFFKIVTNFQKRHPAHE